MADVSKITGSNGTPYDIKDTKARGVVCTKAQYDAWEQAGTLDPDIDYHIPDGMPQSLLDIIYPVGSIYLSVNSSNPSSLFGGTWVAWGAGRVPVGVDANDTEFDTVEETGGSKTVTLTSAQSGVPSHSHTYTSPTVSSSGYVANGITGGSHTHTLTTGNNFAVYGVATSEQQISYNSTPGSGNGGFSSSLKSTTHTHNLPNHTHTLTGGGVANNTATDASKAHNNLQPYITCYMWKRTA